jgi:hypothetical protein
MFPTKIMVLAGISHDFKSAVIGAIECADGFVSASGVIPEMNSGNGTTRWTFM